MHIGMVGLGKMGMNMSRRLIEGGHEVTGLIHKLDNIEETKGYGIGVAMSAKELVDALPSPRIVWLMVPSGAVVDTVIEELKGFLSNGDVIIDGGNTFYKDDIRRSAALAEAGIEFADVGTSGGIWGLQEGYCLMIGGKREVFEQLKPLFITLAPKDGYLYCGETGSGHFVKMVHNGIEYAMMESYAEGFELLEASPYGKDLDFAKVSGLWNRGSVIRSWLLELIESAFEKDGTLSDIEGYVEDSGEGRWTVQEAVDLGVAAPAISAALFRRFRSRQDSSFAERILAAMRKEFGGHSVKSAEG
ncbi:6-phosphogluconate dehydrogenase, decarboxylating [hydrothermal vent metagenome]|uniref:6-phosphogluconate dehydrogenase, decarboxylating n=1 Tax=hydrothermal vent metagenome TaxID=652676 RepID=A0A3B0V0Y6_9ZZZZ